MITLSPAYGRDYTSAKAVKADWTAGKDFRIESYGPDMGRYIGKEEADREKLTVCIRYKRLTQVCVIKPA
jgi:hypothetical protein